MNIDKQQAISSNAVVHGNSQSDQVRAFVSYSWKNVMARDAIISAFREHEITPVYDIDAISPSDELTPSLLRLLRSSDVVVALLTSESLQSKAVLEELARAHEARVRILPLVQADMVGKLPAYLKDIVYHSYIDEQNLMTKIDDIAKEISRCQERIKLESIYRTMNTLLSFLPDRKNLTTPISESEILAYEQCIASLEGTEDVLSTINRTEFEVRIDLAHTFIRNAIPIFSRASKVYATSIDTISTFWSDSNKKSEILAHEYWNIQNQQTERIFAFSSPDSANLHRDVLNLHNMKYGVQGRVYVTSHENYLRLMEGCGFSADDSDVTRSDFAIIISKDDQVYHAKLTNNRLTNTRIGSLSSKSLGYRKNLGFEVKSFIDLFSRLNTLQPGEVNSKEGVMRWSHDIFKDTDTWVNILSGLFESRNSDVYHMVFFSKRVSGADIQDCIYDVLKMIESMTEYDKSKIKLRDFWFGEAVELNVVDGLTKARLNTRQQEYPHVLSMRFHDQDGLKYWYELVNHSEVRRKILERFNDKDILDAFSKIDVHEGNSTERRDLYQKVESSLLPKYMKRADYVEQRDLVNIVKSKGYQPKITYIL